VIIAVIFSTESREQLFQIPSHDICGAMAVKTRNNHYHTMAVETDEPFFLFRCPAKRNVANDRPQNACVGHTQSKAESKRL